MTNNEAIIVLKNIAWLGTDAERQQIEEAVEMAINALKAQELANNSPELDNNFGDLISRAAAIDAMPQRIEGCGGESWMMTYRRSGHNDCVDVCLNAIRNLPSVQPEQSSEIQDILDYLDAVLHPIISPENWNVYSELHDMISTLPSAQPETHEERTETHACDCIDRQAAIDEIKEIYEWHDNVTKERIIEHFVRLPSVQPEQHTCVNCGRTVNNGGWYADGRTRCPIEEHYALPKDGYCHLWEKRNVTDDDYPERREE